MHPDPYDPDFTFGLDSLTERELPKVRMDQQTLGRKSTFLRALALISLLTGSWILVMVCVLLPISLLVVNAIHATGRT